jgi:transglutaminase-like putative cysteine protease
MSLNRLAIREGWTTVLLVAAVVYVSIWSILQADWADGLHIINLCALAGLIAGFVVAKWRSVPSLAAHAAGLAFGALVILFQMTNYLDDRLGGRIAKLRWLWGRGHHWASLILQGKHAEDLYLFVLFICVVSFLLAYGTIWFVLRARWIWAALVMPGMLLFINLGYSRRVPNSYVVFFLFFAILLLVRFALLERETDWRRSRIEYPTTLAWRGLWAATYLAVVVLMFGWIFPTSARSERVHDAWLNVDGPWRSVEARFNDWFGGLRGPGSGGVGGFASFSDEFELGGPLRLSDTPVVVVSGTSNAPYLAAHRYAVYTGHGWQSDVAQDPNDTDTTRQPFPQIELKQNEKVPVDDAVSGQRDARPYTLQLQNPRGSLMFAPEQFSSSSIDANLVLYWRTVDNQHIDLSAPPPPDTPDDLATLITLLQTADFTPPQPATPTPDPNATLAPTTTVPDSTATATPSPTVSPTPQPPAPESQAIRDERDQLAARGITTTYAIDPVTYKVVSLNYSGRFPVFDEVEAVYARDGLSAGQKYAVSSLESTATSDELRQLPMDYPAEIQQRYLALPDTVTQRTVDLAHSIGDSQGTAYDKAIALQNYLRGAIVYTEDIKYPPADQDVVDYVLFDSKQGYCEYYASAFVVMARELGLPTRMAVGFFPGDKDDNAGGFLYRERNAHAWPEVYFPGKGWIRFEPTANRQPPNYDPAPAPAPVDPNASPVAGIGALGDVPPEDPFLRLDRLREGGGGVVTVSHHQTVSRTQWAVRVGSLGLMALVLVLGYFWLRGMRGLTPVGQLYTKLGRGASWGGVKPTPAMTPNEYAQALARDVPGSRAPASFLTDLYVRETYGKQQPTQMDMLRARQAWLRLRGLLVKYFFARLRPWSPHAPRETDNGEW